MILRTTMICSSKLSTLLSEQNWCFVIKKKTEAQTLSGQLPSPQLLPTYISGCIELHVCLAVPDPLQSHGLQPTRLLSPWAFPGKNTGVGCHFLPQGIFPTQGSNLVSCISCIGRRILYHSAIWEAHLPQQTHNGRYRRTSPMINKHATLSVTAGSPSNAFSFLMKFS